MTSYVIMSVVSGILFGFLGGLINANPMAHKLFHVYRPIARTSVNVAAGVFSELAYGSVLAALFPLFYQSWPGDNGLWKGLSFGLIVWFLRVLMSVASLWMMFKVSLQASCHTFLAGLGEMLVLGALYGFTLQPFLPKCRVMPQAGRGFETVRARQGDELCALVGPIWWDNAISPECYNSEEKKRLPGTSHRRNSSGSIPGLAAPKVWHRCLTISTNRKTTSLSIFES